jgi:hypothetical protein
MDMDVYERRKLTFLPLKKGKQRSSPGVTRKDVGFDTVDKTEHIEYEIGLPAFSHTSKLLQLRAGLRMSAL